MRLQSTLTRYLLILLLALVSGCTLFTPKQAGIGREIDWVDLPGWFEDDLSSSWPALINQCRKLSAKHDYWRSICSGAAQIELPTDKSVRDFLQRHFQPHEIIGTDGTPNGLITGYYEPTLHGSMQPDERYAYPIYKRPEALLIIELGDLYPSLKNKRVRGRLAGNKIVPYYKRMEIDGDERPLQGNEILWIDDPYGSFFLQIQGSGRVQMDDGSMLKLGYSDQNGHKYVSIGKRLIEANELSREEVSLFSIREWLKYNPERAMELLNQNPSYVFFTVNENNDEGPRGSLNVPLTAERSVAVDRSVIPLGTPLWLSTTLPTLNATHTGNGRDYQRLIYAQDTGGAITGIVRADVFFGHGLRAEQLAGHMKQPGKLYALLPRQSLKVAEKPSAKRAVD